MNRGSNGSVDTSPVAVVAVATAPAPAAVQPDPVPTLADCDAAICRRAFRPRGATTLMPHVTRHTTHQEISQMATQTTHVPARSLSPHNPTRVLNHKPESQRKRYNKAPGAHRHLTIA